MSIPPKATQRDFVSVPLDGRDLSELEAQLVALAGPDPISVGGSHGYGCATVRVPADPTLRSEVLRVIRQWREHSPS